MALIAPSHPFDGARLKLSRAREHLDVLEAAVKVFRDTKPYRIETKAYADTGFFRMHIRIRENPPIALSGVIGDVVQNLRSCLDHVICVFAERGGGDCLPPRAFPVFNDESSYESSAPNYLLGVSRDIRTIVKRLQPFAGGRDPDTSILWQLHRLAIIDRHRTLLTAATAFAEATVKTPIVMELVGGIRQGPFQDGAIVAEARLRPGAPYVPYMYVNFDFPATVGFGEGTGPAIGSPCVEMLEGTMDYIRSVVREFETFV